MLGQTPAWQRKRQSTGRCGANGRKAEGATAGAVIDGAARDSRRSRPAGRLALPLWRWQSGGGRQQDWWAGSSGRECHRSWAGSARRVCIRLRASCRRRQRASGVCDVALDEQRCAEVCSIGSSAHSDPASWSAVCRKSGAGVTSTAAEATGSRVVKHQVRDGRGCEAAVGSSREEQREKNKLKLSCE